MNSIGKECIELKKTYDECFNSWFADKFLKGYTKDTCEPLFRVYQECVQTAIKEQKIDLWEVNKNVLGTENEQTVPKKKNQKSEKPDKSSEKS